MSLFYPHIPLFMFMSWNNGTHCMSYYVLSISKHLQLNVYNLYKHKHAIKPCYFLTIIRRKGIWMCQPLTLYLSYEYLSVKLSCSQFRSICFGCYFLLSIKIYLQGTSKSDFLDFNFYVMYIYMVCHSLWPYVIFLVTFDIKSIEWARKAFVYKPCT